MEGDLYGDFFAGKELQGVDENDPFPNQKQG
jgi:hypothetical protein